MKLSTDHILTTHTGSLPRPQELVQLTYEQEEGKPVDRQVMADAQAHAVDQVVRRQAEAGIDVVSDGEMAKPGFTNYLTSRVTGCSVAWLKLAALAEGARLASDRLWQTSS